MIIDSSSLIIFAKINKLDLLVKLYKKIEITREIYRETVEEGLIIEAPDAKVIKKFIDEGKIKIVELKDKYKRISQELARIYPQIEIGESSAISLCLQEENKTLIIDEANARKVAKLYRLRPIGSLRVLLDSYKNNIIEEAELKQVIGEMVNNKFRLSGDVVNEFWNIFDKIKRR